MRRMDAADGLKVLIVEDDAQTGAYIRDGLADAGHQVAWARDGRDGLQRATGEHWDLLIVDRMLPHIQGLEIVESVRQQGSEVSVLLLTALDGVDDRVRGLNAGADDYLVKPFALSELLARVAALGRRARRPGPETRLKYADLELELLSRAVMRAGQPIELLPREFQLLEYLMRHAEQTVTRSMLLEHVWDVHFEPNTNVVETHVSRLRSKVDRGHGRTLIHTIRGIGYCLREAK
jgi:two-component system OmpR family response regulator